MPFLKAEIRAKTADFNLFTFVLLEPLIISTVKIFNLSNKQKLSVIEIIKTYCFIFKKKQKNLKNGYVSFCHEIRPL